MLFIIGLVFGSFFAALTYRYPKRISNFSGRSFCDNCKKQIAWHDNIPLLSFLLLGGKCRKCRTKISPRYPLIELATGIGFVLIGWNLCYLALFGTLLSIFIIDFEHQIIPDDFVFAGILFALLLPNFSFFNNLLAGFLTASFLVLIHIVTKGRGMGLGDVKFAVLGGAIIGLALSPIWMLLAFLTGAAAGIILILSKKAGLKSKIAFGPFLVASIPITLLYGDMLIKFIGLR